MKVLNNRSISGTFAEQSLDIRHIRRTDRTIDDGLIDIG
jgi:hypothetical protein